jgi:hypothetical protein
MPSPDTSSKLAAAVLYWLTSRLWTVLVGMIVARFCLLPVAVVDSVICSAGRLPTAGWLRASGACCLC